MCLPSTRKIVSQAPGKPDKPAGSLFLIALLLISFTAALLAAEKPEFKLVELESAKEKSLPKLYLDQVVDPNVYIVGPGDKFRITFYGADYEPIELTILPEGILAIPNLGEVNLGQVTLREAKEKIAAQVRSRFKVKEVGVSLTQPRLFKVNVTGGVESPGAVVVSASARVSEAIELAGGLAHKASRRNIRLLKSGGHTTYADLDFFNATGRLESNPYLHEGQVVFVPVVSDSFNTIEVYGAVNKPGSFEFKEGDRITDLLSLSFGPAFDADLENAELVRFVADNREKVSLAINVKKILADTGSSENILLRPDDRLFLRAIAGYHKKEKVTIMGEIKFPGVYPIEDGCRTLSQLVSRAGGILDRASLVEAAMFRLRKWNILETTSFDQLLKLEIDKLTDFELQYLKANSAGQPGKVAVDFKKLLEENRLEFDVPLYDGDRISIPHKSYTVTVLGRVVNPGQVSFCEGQNVGYYIHLAGGFGYKADKKNMRIIKANTGSLLKADSKVPLEMGDRIMVPQTKGTNWWGLIKDAGLFLANVATIYVVIDQAVN